MNNFAEGFHTEPSAHTHEHAQKPDMNHAHVMRYDDLIARRTDRSKKEENDRKKEDPDKILAGEPAHGHDHDVPAENPQHQTEQILKEFPDLAKRFAAVLTPQEMKSLVISMSTIPTMQTDIHSDFVTIVGEVHASYAVGGNGTLVGAVESWTHRQQLSFAPSRLVYHGAESSESGTAAEVSSGLRKVEGDALNEALKKIEKGNVQPMDPVIAGRTPRQMPL